MFKHNFLAYDFDLWAMTLTDTGANEASVKVDPHAKKVKGPTSQPG